MKFLLLFLPIFLSAQWSFTEYDFYNLSKEQLRNVHTSYLVGQEKDLGLTLASIAIVETRATIANDFNDNHVCGVHQINTDHVEVPCKAIESNVYLTAKLAMENFLFWYHGPAKKDWSKALIMYNGGYKFNPHGHEYIRRIAMVFKVLKEHYDK